jgi:methylenetetrahydrofolate--tRNA-(uracil-5-)-methyltransferase
VCQLRRETAAGESRNLVGFQTRLTVPEQKRVFRLIPGLANAEFLRLGSIHRNSYLDSPRLLTGRLSFAAQPALFCAGQLCGNEGYTESIATGHLAGLFAWGFVSGHEAPPPPPVTALGALLRHVTKSPVRPFEPSGMHFGLFPAAETPPGRRIPKAARHGFLCRRALDAAAEWMNAFGRQGAGDRAGVGSP